MKIDKICVFYRPDSGLFQCIFHNQPFLIESPYYHPTNSQQIKKDHNLQNGKKLEFGKDVKEINAPQNMYSEITVWSVTHNCLHFTLWVTRSLIIINEALFLTVSNSLIVKYALYIPISGLQNTQNSITIKKLCFNCTPHAWNSFFIKLTFSSVSLSFSAAILLFWHISRHLAFLWSTPFLYFCEPPEIFPRGARSRTCTHNFGS